MEKMGETLAYQEQDLTSLKLHDVARQLVSPLDVRSLGLRLGVADYTIDAALYNHKGDIQEAAYAVLKEWFKGQENRTEAYVQLHTALRHLTVGLSHEAEEVLNSLGSDPIEGNVDLLYDFLTITPCAKLRKFVQMWRISVNRYLPFTILY